MHCHQLVQSRQEYPKDLFWDLYFFSSISKTFLPQLMLSQPSLPTTQHRAVSEGLLGRQRHSMLSSTVWSDRPFEVGRWPSRALQWQQVSRTAHWCKTKNSSQTAPVTPCGFWYTARLQSYPPWGYSGLQSPLGRPHRSFGRKGCWLCSPVPNSCFPPQHAWNAIRRFFVAFIRPRLEYCSAVWCGASLALLKDLEKVQLRVARAIVRNTTLQDMSTLHWQAWLPTLSWQRREHCLGLLWQLSIGKGPPALQASLVPCAQLRSTRFPHSF